MDHQCQREDCEAQATGVLALQFYPPVALMQWHHTDKPLTHMVVNLEMCEKHRSEIDPLHFLDAGLVESTIRLVEKSSGCAVDRQATKAVLVPFDHPDVLMLRSRKK